jgi:hypothetical protein
MSRRPAPARRVRGLVLTATIVLAAASAASAHDLWIMAGQYRLELFESTRVFINSGDAFPQSLSLLGEHRVTALALHGPTDKRAISEFRVEGKSLSFEIQPMSAGSHVVALSTRERRVRLRGSDFTSYLEASRLDAIVALVEELGEAGEPAVELYSKWAKAVIDVDEAADSAPTNASGVSAEDEPPPAWSKPVGHRLEIIPVANPNEITPGERLMVQVLYEGEPLVGVSVTGGQAGGPAGEIVARTDELGRAEVTITSAARWYLRAIHMIRRDDDPDVRWESFWSTLTFEVRD